VRKKKKEEEERKIENTAAKYACPLLWAAIAKSMLDMVRKHKHVVRACAKT